MRRRLPITLLGTGAAVAVLALLAALVGPAQQAHAAYYKYWGFWQVSAGAWGFAAKGPDQTTPADGSVDGWRYAVSDESSTRTPRVLPTFAQLCASTPAEDGKKRVGLVVDFGRDADGDGTTPPPALAVSCAVVPTAATSSDVLATAGKVRVGGGFVCGVAGYPATGCADAVATVTDAMKAADTPLALPTPSATPTPTPSAVAAATTTAAATTSGSGIPSWVWIVLVLAALGAVLVQLVRNRRQ